MNQKFKTTGLIALALIFISLGSAEVALTVPESSQEIEGLETSYRIGLINTGSEARNISFTVDSPEALDASIPETVSLPPSNLSSSPEGDNWYQASPSRYVRINYVTLNVSVDAQVAEKRRFNFSVLVSTTRESSISRPQVSSVNQLDFILRSRSSEIDTEFDGSLWEEPESGSEGEDEGRNISEEASTGDSSQPDNSTKEQRSQDQDTAGRDKDSGPEAVTIILLLGIVLTTGYVLSEVMI
jgi:hypothetical protein